MPQNYKQQCPNCGANYSYGSACYAYYHCGTKYEKPFTGETGRYLIKCKRVSSYG